MKRLLTIFFLLAGIAFAHSAYAQDGGKKKKKSKKSEQASPNREQPSGSGAPDEIAIDEGGAPKVKKTGTPTQSAPSTAGDTIPKNKKAEQQTSERAAPAPPGGSPEPIAIDEGGTPKVKRPETAGGSNPPSSDSVIKAPADLIGRPQD